MSQLPYFLSDFDNFALFCRELFSLLFKINEILVWISSLIKLELLRVEYTLLEVVEKYFVIEILHTKSILILIGWEIKKSTTKIFIVNFVDMKCYFVFFFLTSFIICYIKRHFCIIKKTARFHRKQMRNSKNLAYYFGQL